MEKKLLKISRYIFTAVLAVVLVFTAYFSLIFASVSKRESKWLALTISRKGLSITQSSFVNNKKVMMKEAINSADARPVIIKKYLEKYKSPLVPYSDLIFELSQQYGFEYYWIVAIGQQESNLCKKIPENSHNCWGYGIHSAGTLKFDNYEIALRSFAEYLKRVYFDKGLNTPELIMRKYCPHSDGSWAFGVRQFINEMESGSFY